MPWWNRYPLLNRKNGRKWCPVCRGFVKMLPIKNIGVLVDAEESWIQDPVDALTILMMDTFNRSKAVVFNTIQLYRHDRLAFP